MKEFTFSVAFLLAFQADYNFLGAYLLPTLKGKGDCKSPRIVHGGVHFVSI